MRTPPAGFHVYCCPATRLLHNAPARQTVGQTRTYVMVWPPSSLSGMVLPLFHGILDGHIHSKIIYNASDFVTLMLSQTRV